jgi:chromosome segregation ATPase
MQGENVVSLRSTKAQLEVGLIYLQRRHTELERQLTLVESQGRHANLHPDALAQLRRTVQEHAIQIERRKREIQDIDERIGALHARVERFGSKHLHGEHDEVTKEIAQIREKVLSTLKDLADPLKRYDELIERKNQLARDIAARTGRNQAYANYIEGALIRQSEYVDEVKFALEALKRIRVVC